jgi:hypothetical protein
VETVTIMINNPRGVIQNNLSIILIISLLLIIFATWAVSGSKIDRLAISEQLLKVERASLTSKVEDSEKREKLAQEHAVQLQKDYELKIKELKISYAKSNKNVNEKFDSIIAGIDTISFDSAYIQLSAEGRAFN